MDSLYDLTLQNSSSQEGSLNDEVSNFIVNIDDIENSYQAVDVIENLISNNENGISFNDILTLKKIILTKKLPMPNETSDTEENKRINNTRIKVWKIFLGVSLDLDIEEYFRKIEMSPNVFVSKIKNDGFRTFKGNESFWNKATEDIIIRILEAIAVDFGYVQGMNILLGPFLYIMPEIDSYYCFKSLVQHQIPTYIMKNLEGVHTGITLFKHCLDILDKELFDHITAKFPDLSILSLKYLLTLFANTQPLDQVIFLWDIVFAFGSHSVVLLLCSFLMMNRADILAEKSAFRILRYLEGINLSSRLLVDHFLANVKRIPDDLFDLLVKHPLKLEDTLLTNRSFRMESPRQGEELIK